MSFNYLGLIASLSAEDVEKLSRDELLQLSQGKVKFERRKPSTLRRYFRALKALRRCSACLFICFCLPLPPLIIPKLVFSPPKPAMYSLRRKGVAGGMLTYEIEYCAALKRIKAFGLWQYKENCFCTLITFVTPPCAERIVCVYIRNSAAKLASCTILYSQCNSTDLGWMMPELMHICKRLSCDVVAYDYNGYGQSCGRPKESNIYRDVAAVYDFAVGKLHIPAERIVAWGFSLGSAASIDLACNRPLRGLILQSTFPSAIRVAFPTSLCTHYPCDQFLNYEKIKKVSCPTLLLHGEKDQVADYEVALSFARKCPGAVEPLILKSCGHTNLNNQPEVWQRIHLFITQELVNAASCVFKSSE